MPPRPYEIYLKLPDLDCGVCGSPTCMTFARSLAARKTDAKLCPFSAKNIAEIERIAAISEFPRPVSGKSVSIIKPCVTDSAKVMGEAQLAFASGEKPVFGCFDVISMKYLLGLKYPEMMFSFKLGSAKLQLQDGSRALVFENGYLSIREVKNAETLNKNIDYLARLLWGAAICPSCASTVLESASGGCGQCHVLARPALTSNKQEQVKLAIDIPWEINREPFKQIDSLLKDVNSSSKEAVRNRIVSSLLHKLLEVEKEDSGSAVLLISLFLNLSRAIKAKSQAGDRADKSWLLLQRVWNLVKHFDISEHKALLTESELCRARILNEIKSSGDRDLIKPLIIANSAFSIARSVGKS